jgi:hypothetical protein
MDRWATPPTLPVSNCCSSRRQRSPS